MPGPKKEGKFLMISFEDFEYKPALMLIYILAWIDQDKLPSALNKLNILILQKK